MKLLSIIVPCYNAQAYLKKCVDSLLVGGQKVEIILVDDGSTDKTATMIDEYATNYPSLVKTIHQANGGYGQAVNTGLQHAQRIYIKIVDGDDWLDQVAYQKALATIESWQKDECKPDVLLTNYIYDKQGVKYKKTMEYSKLLPQEEVFDWSRVKVRLGKYFLMHAIIYRKELLQKMAFQLPAHTFYVDNLYAFEPLFYAKKLYYLDVDLYHYFIGRSDQSVNEKVMISRIDQQLFVNRRMVEFYAQNVVPDSFVGKYLFNYLEIITAISSILLLKDGSNESLRKKEQLWHFIETKDQKLYQKLRLSLVGKGLNMPGKAGRKLALAVYFLAQKMYGFN